jgi:hypothetical protein
VKRADMNSLPKMTGPLFASHLHPNPAEAVDRSSFAAVRLPLLNGTSWEKHNLVKHYRIND